MLIILGGLPGTGKTTIARELARQLRAVHVRIDSIEEAILDSGYSAHQSTMLAIVWATQLPRTISGSAGQ
ncbi:MAG: AAA family ATPase [Terriglobales bacterium]